MSRSLTALGAAALCALPAAPLSAQPVALPPVTVQADSPRPNRAVRPARDASVPRRTAAQPPAPTNAAAPAAAPSPSLTVPTTAAATVLLDRTPGAVELVPDSVFKQTPAQTLKDIVDYVPGVWAQPKWGDDTRLSIRGSGLSRNFHLRGTQLYMDGIPINTSDGYGDFQEIDPTAYRYVEIFKGANALRFGANALGGAINFVMPTGRDANAFESRLDAGAFGYRRTQAGSGGSFGAADYFITGSAFTTDGYRDHSFGHGERGSANIGYRASDDFETRFYVNANTIRQRIPGEVTKTDALNNPQGAASANLLNDWQRNIDTLRIANKSTLKLGDTTVEFGVFGVDRHLMHPIFQYLDYRYADYGGFVRAVDERVIAGHRNRLTVGVNIQNGRIDANQYANVGGTKGTPTSALIQKPENYSAYIENAWYATPSVSLIAGVQYLYAIRDQAVTFSLNGDVAGRSSFSLPSPKVGVLWDASPTWQVFANVSRSAEAPSFGESVAPGVTTPNFPTIRFFDTKAQQATTFEIGTRERREDYTFDIALYRAEIHNELMCYYSTFGTCNVTNADRTYHQGVEAGGGLALIKGIFDPEKDKVWLNVAYTYSDFRFSDDAAFGNNRLPGAPPHVVRAELLYRHANGFSFGPNIEWVPSAYYVDSANTLTTEPYLLWGLRMAYDNGKGLSAYVEGRNLSDKAYIATTSIVDRANAATSRLFNPGNGRAVFAGVRYRL